MDATARTAALRARAATADFMRHLDAASLRVERWWQSQRPSAKLVTGVVAIFAAAGLLNAMGAGLGRASAPRVISAATAVAAPALMLEAPPAAGTKAWTVVRTWQGSGARETESFTVGDHWRVDWLFSPTQPSAQLQVFIYAQDGRLLLNVASNTQREGADSSFWIGPGTYFLKVNAAGGDWKLDVQDLR